MIYLYLLCILTVLFCPVARIAGRGEWNESYISQKNTLPIKGFFTMLVFFRHIKTYMTLSGGMGDRIFLLLDQLSGQLIVAMFFFYSGYGIFESLRKKGQAYKTGFFRNRILPVWLSFVAAVLLYLIMDLLLGKSYSLQTILFSLIGWESIGNSNWFMFVSFGLYAFTALAFVLWKNGTERQIAFTVTVLSAALGIVLYFTKEHWWYTTLLCYSGGMWYSLYREKIEAWLKGKGTYWIALALTTIALAGLYFVQRKLTPAYCLLSLVFAFEIVLITMKIDFRSTVMAFLGKYVFGIYILQRLPMIVLEGRIQNNLLFFAVCFAVTLLLAMGFNRLTSGIKTVCKTKSNQ